MPFNPLYPPTPRRRPEPPAVIPDEMDKRGPRALRRAKGFRTPVRPTMGPVRHPRLRPARHPMAWVDPATNEAPEKPMTAARQARRAAKAAARDLDRRPTRRERLKMIRLGNPGATRRHLRDPNAVLVV